MQVPKTWVDFETIFVYVACSVVHCTQGADFHKLRHDICFFVDFVLQGVPHAFLGL